MEKQLSLISKKAFFISFLILFSVFRIYSQNVSFAEHIRLPLWAELDVYPGFQSESVENLSEESEDDLNNEEKSDTSEDIFSFPKNRIRETSYFLLDGMVYGWDFVYVPSDKARGVEEEFEITPIQTMLETNCKIKFSSPYIQNERLYCWIDYDRKSFQIQNYNLWSDIQHPSIQGTGYGQISDGFDGIKNAASDAIKNAVRTYYRGLVKNKPKEITGSVLIRKEPVLGIDAGQYVIKLDFFLEYGKIKEYTQF